MAIIWVSKNEDFYGNLILDKESVVLITVISP